MDEQLPSGRYDSVVTEHLARLLAEHDDSARMAALDRERMPEVLSRHLRQVAARVLAEEKDPARRLALLNDALTQLKADADRVVGPDMLVAIQPEVQPGRDVHYGQAPRTPLSEVALLTNARGEPGVGSELRSELHSVDSVDLICAFIKYSGLRLMDADLRVLARLGIRFRVITTTYLGATDRRALDRLVRDYGAEVKVQYEALRTRLHAKAWHFGRNSGFDTAYVGSSNLSQAALLDGLEWNVRLSSEVTPGLIDKIRATFESYWQDPTFESYDPDRDADRLDRALELARAGGRGLTRVGTGDTGRDGADGAATDGAATDGAATDGAGADGAFSLDGLAPQPFGFQVEVLEALATEREVHGRRRNLIVAATGTGKTMMAAFDYRRLCEAAGGRPTLLFVAHRVEILQQAMRSYREVLGDPNFGDLYVGGREPAQWRHLFASIQTLNTRELDRLAADSFEVVVVDEFHHAAAASYRAVLDRLDPQQVLGLTATPERADGVNVADAFFEGRIAAEIRLWDALRADLLCPFHYFGIADGTDLSQLDWSGGRYATGQLQNLYTGNDARLRVILRELRDKVTSVTAMRALGFCAGVNHARYMAEAFNEHGIPALVVTGETPPQERAQALTSLRSGEVNIIFTADLYNEGVDIPEVDTVLFLRPTESATIFLQQLGRGLRRTPDKAVLTVLDFVGHHRKEFRFDRRFTALTGVPRGDLARHVEHGFPYLPSGCQIVLDKTSQEVVLSHLRSQLSSRWADVVADVRANGDVDLATFLRLSDRPVSDLYRNKRSWSQARREAGLATREAGLVSRGAGPAGSDAAALEAGLLSRVWKFHHVDDAERASVYLDLLADDAPSYRELVGVKQRFADMFVYNLWPDPSAFESFDTALASLHAQSAFRDELAEIISLALDQAPHRPRRLGGTLGLTPLRSHCSYTREELGAALGYFHAKRLPKSLQQGVFRVDEQNADVFLVTLNKSDDSFSHSTMYRDYAISPELFHWESQSVTSLASGTGQRYVNQRTNGNQVLMFVREERKDLLAQGTPYLLLGTAQYVEHRGERPIAITYQLDRPMPADVYAVASAIAN